MSASAATNPLRAKARKFPCEGCGADLRWEPGATALKCEYCGFEKLVARGPESIRERPVDAALRAPRDLGWGAERKVVVCKRCGAHTTLDPHVSASACAFCATTAVVEAPPNANVVRPEGLLPFRITRESALQTFRKWLIKLWLRPNDLKSASRMTALQGAYIPFWTFDAATDSYWTAEAGYYYYVDAGSGKDRRRERRVRWEHTSGSLQLFFDDVPVPASRGVDSSLCRNIEPYPTAELTPYEPSYLSGFLAEENAIDLPEALETAKERMRGDIRSACAGQVPGDTHRNLQVQTAFSALAYKNALLPVWIAAYDYRGKPYRFLVNGVTGKCTGTAPWSWIKVTLTVLALLTFVVILLAIAGQS
ncbi:MAG TPA: zinc ribbon domain-containing protein [Thermoanaerobaculia bacterium]|nr:zinc ribbon domain-containing protein [Thermoanaerobaculia bacterium]